MSVYARFKRSPEGFRKLVELLESTPPSRRQKMIDVGMEEDAEYTNRALQYVMNFDDIIKLPDTELAEVCAKGSRQNDRLCDPWQLADGCQKAISELLHAGKHGRSQRHDRDSGRPPGNRGRSAQADSDGSRARRQGFRSVQENPARGVSSLDQLQGHFPKFAREIANGEQIFPHLRLVALVAFEGIDFPLLRVQMERR